MPDKALSVITLRRVTRPGTGEREVAWTHRWIRRGHWRQQPYKEAGAWMRRAIWIHPTICGPEDKPLLVRDRVYALKRYAGVALRPRTVRLMAPPGASTVPGTLRVRTMPGDLAAPRQTGAVPMPSPMPSPMSEGEPQAPPPGWYTHPSGQTRWFDGVTWTDHVAPVVPAPTAPSPPTNPQPVVSHLTHGGLTNGQHLTHAILTFCTGGLWGIVWWFAAWSTRTKSNVHYR